MTSGTEKLTKKSDVLGKRVYGGGGDTVELVCDDDDSSPP